MWRSKNAGPILALASLLLALPHPALSQRETGEVLAPKDATFALELLSSLDSKTNKKGDKFDCKVLSPVEYAGAIVSGHVKKAKSSGKANGKSEMDLDFDTIMLGDGRVGGFDAQVKEVNEVANASDDGRADVEGTVKGKSRVMISVKRAVIGAGIGAILGGIVAGGQGAAVGAAIGAGIGVTTTLAREGPNLEFKTGTQFTVLTNAPSHRKASLENTAARPAPAPGSAATVAPPSLGTAQPPTPPAASTPAPPSPQYRTYSGNLFSLSVPGNWREMPSGNIVVFAPDGASVNVQGRTGYTHNAMAGVVPAAGRDLQQATESLMRGFLRSNSHLRAQSAYIRWQLANRSALAVALSGTWPATMHVERVTVYTAMLRNGSLFFLITVVPQEDAASYQPVFVTMARSVQIKD
jgi:hypothetical protein